VVVVKFAASDRHAAAAKNELPFQRLLTFVNLEQSRELQRHPNAKDKRDDLEV